MNPNLRLSETAECCLTCYFGTFREGFVRCHHAANKWEMGGEPGVNTICDRYENWEHPPCSYCASRDTVVRYGKISCLKCKKVMELPEWI